MCTYKHRHGSQDSGAEENSGGAAGPAQRATAAGVCVCVYIYICLCIHVYLNVCVCILYM